MATSARDRIIHSAHDLFYKIGFHAVGVDMILADVGVTKTTFYNHFESKDDLVHEVLNWHDCWWRNTFVQMLRQHGGDTPRGQLLAVFDAITEIFKSEEFNGCFFINVAVQFPQHHDPAHQAAVTHKSAMEDIIRELAGYAGADDPLSFAQELSLIMEGSYVTRQVTGKVEAADIAKRIATMVVDKHIPVKG